MVKHRKVALGTAFTRYCAPLLAQRPIFGLNCLNMPENIPKTGQIAPKERLQRRDRFQEAAYWVLLAFLAAQFGLMAWLDLRKSG